MRQIFDSKLELLDAELIVMGTAIEDVVRESTELLKSRDTEKAVAIVEGDDDMDRQEKGIESLCIRLFLTQQPVAVDLRRISAALKMVGDMERIADQAADIAEITITLERGLEESILTTLSLMGDHACKMVHDSVESYTGRNERIARQVIEEDTYMNDLFDRAKWDIIAAIQVESSPASDLAEALMAAKYLERIGDHAKNIAEWVEYSLLGSYKGEPIG